MLPPCDRDSHGIRCSFRVFCSLTYRPYGLGVPTLPLALASALWFSLSEVNRLPFSYNQRHPLFEFGVPPEYVSVSPSRLASARQLLSWAFVPFSTCRASGSTLMRVLPRLASVRLQGLVTLLTVFSPPALTGFVSHRQRSWDFPFGAVIPSDDP